MSPENKYSPLEDRIGRLTRDPEDKTSQWGEFTSLNIAVTRQYGDPGETDFVSVAVKKDRLRELARSLRKGQRIAVKGNYRSKTNNGKTYHDLTAFELYRASDAEEAGDNW